MMTWRTLQRAAVGFSLRSRRQAEACRSTLKRAPHFMLVLLLSPLAFGLNPALDVSQYGHFSWKYRDGFTRGEIQNIAQTPDGYLWLGTAFGLYRFDGIKPVQWQLPPNQSLPSSNILRLAAARDGTLWIGTRNGLASWKNGQLTQYAELAGLNIPAIIESHDGSIWAAGRAGMDGKLCEIRGDTVRCEARDGDQRVFGLHEDRKRNLWAGTLTGVWRWKPGPPEFYSVPGEPDGIQGLADEDDGALLITTTGAVKRIADGKVQAAYPYPASMREVKTTCLLLDHDGGLWIGTAARGIVHVHQGKTDVFSQSDGLSGEYVYTQFEDREGNVWVATSNGLDRFREVPVVTYSANQGLSSTPSGSVLAAKDGSVWFGTRDGLNRLWNGQETVYRPSGVRAGAGVREIAVSGLPNGGVGTLFQDSHGRIWVSSQTGIGYLDNDRFVLTSVPGGYVHTIAGDPAGNVWFANKNLGLFRWSPGIEIQEIPWTTFGGNDNGGPLAADPQGGVWLGFSKGGVGLFRDGQVRVSYSAANGLGEGPVNDLRFDTEGALWIASDGGLSRLKDGRITTLTSKNGLPCDAVHWTIEDAASVWLGMPCGLVRVARAELDGRSTIHPIVFDSSDGVRSLALAGGYTPHASKSLDGKLWFATADGLGGVDPGHLPFNKLPPPVHVESVKINGKDVAPEEGLKLSHSSNELEIRYTALSFTNPDRVQFRYMLEGKDKDWRDAGTERLALYGGLAPRHYRFRVMASNNDGVWNEAGAAWNFTIVPAYYQTLWFQGLVILAAAGMLWFLHWLRLRQMARHFNVQLEARIGERTRIARDLHDKLLQSFQGVLLKFSAARFMLPDRPIEAGDMLDGVIEQARDAITEGRDAVQGLRSATLANTEMAQAITIVGDGLCADHAGPDCPGFRVQVEGASRELARVVRDEIYRIGIEALRNAFRHSHAKQIEVEIHYDRRQFRMRIRDDGKGIDPKILGEGGRKGHHGLPGMQERARLAGGRLGVWSKPDSGTEIELTVPGAIAYGKSRARERVGVG